MNTTVKVSAGDFAKVFFGGLLFAALCCWVSGLIVMWLWNWLLPGLFGFAKIGWCQAWGLTFLCSILFKSSNSKK